MIRKIKNVFINIFSLLKVSNTLLEENLKNTKEIIWANIYHDSIRGKKYFEELAISPGRWAINYSFLFILVRVLEDVKPKCILEFGLGESSKIISAFLENNSVDAEHVVFEHNPAWIENFNNRYKLSTKSKIKQVSLIQSEFYGLEINTYSNYNFLDYINFDFYIIDGPFGSDKISRCEILEIAKNFQANKEFIILIDDYNRIGEQNMARELMNIFKKNNINITSNVFDGEKSQLLITSARYNYLLSI